MYSVSPELYHEAAARLSDAIDGGNYFSGSLAFRFGDTDCRLTASVIVYRGRLSLPEGGQHPVTDPLLKSGDIVLYKQLGDINDIFWGDMYLLSIDIDGEEYVTVKYIQKSDREGYVKLVSQNPHHADKDVAINRIRAIALVKASIRMNSIR